MFRLFFTGNTQTISHAYSNDGTSKPTYIVKKFKNPKNYTSIASGGEAHVYAISRKKLAKIYKPNFATQDKLDTLIALMGISLPHNVITPSAILNDMNDNFIGYEMDRVKGVELGLLFLPNGVIKHFPKYTLIDLVEMSINILDVFNSIHQQSIIIGDINPRNLLIESKDKVYVIDTDSFQITRPSGVGQIIYTRPKNIGKKFSSYMRTISDDTYALSMIVFQILHYGALPYASSDADSLKIAVYVYNPNSKTNNNVHPDLASAHHRLSLELKNYFYTQFSEQKYVPLEHLYLSLNRYKKTLLKK